MMLPPESAILQKTRRDSPIGVDAAFLVSPTPFFCFTGSRFPLSTQSLIDALAGLSPDADKATLMAAVDNSVSQIVKELGQSKGSVKPELINATRVTLQFLEVCKDLNDPDFSSRTKERANELLQAFGRVQGADAAHAEAAAAKPRKKKKRPVKKGAKGKRPAGAKAKKPEGNPDETSDFMNALVAAFRKYARRRAMLWYVPVHKIVPTPYVLSTKFADNLEAAIEAYFRPKFALNRRILVMNDDLKAQGYEEKAFFAVFDGPKKGNPIRTVWDDGLKEIVRHLSGTAESDKKVQTKSKVKEKPKKGIGNLFGLLGVDKEEKVIERDVEVDTTARDNALAFWNTIAGPDVEYDPPTIEDMAFLHGLFEYHPEDIDSAQQGVVQFLKQEFGSSEAREGAARDNLNELLRSSAECAGELTALWAYLMHPKEFGYSVFKSFTSSQGTTPEQRRDALPLFLRWIPDFTEQTPPRP